MVCDVCRHDAPYTTAQLARRQQELDRNPTIDIYPCPDCGGTDYMLSMINLDQALPEKYDGILGPDKPARIVMAKQLRPPRSLWARLLDWWSFRK